MLLFLFLLSNSFVTVIGCCSLLLFVSQVLVQYQFHWIFVFPNPRPWPTAPSMAPSPQSVFTVPGPQFVFACSLKPKEFF